MNAKTVVLVLFACAMSVTGNTQPPQRFQARKFLDMLARTFNPQEAYLDLLTALHERLNLEPINNASVGMSAADTVVTSPNANADNVVSCPVAPAEKGASVTYTSDSRVLGSRAFYQCEMGYNGKSMFIQCLQGGKWSSLSGWSGCTPVDCGAPPPSVAHADASYTATTYRSVTFYTCQTGYKLDKPNANVTCLDTGYWDTPTFTCEKAVTPALDAANLQALGSLFNSMGGNRPAATNQNPMMAALLKNMPGMSGLPGMPALPAPSQAPANTENNNPMMAMLSQMFPGMAPPATPAPPTTPKPAPVNPMAAAAGGFQLPSHLQSLLPNGLPNTAGIKPQDLMTLTSMGLGSGTSAGAPRDITQLLGSMNPMSIFGGAMGMGVPGQSGALGSGGAGTGVPPDPEKLAEQREEMMRRAAMASAMRSMMASQGSQGNGTSARNPAMEMMTLMALQSGLGGGSGGGSGGSGGMDPMSMMLGGMNPAMLGLGGGGFPGGGGLFANLFGGA